jgi:hypothetical protein
VWDAWFRVSSRYSKKILYSLAIIIRPFPGQSYQAIRDKFSEEGIFKVYTFNSMRKSMSTVGNLIYIYEKDGYSYNFADFRS